MEFLAQFIKDAFFLLLVMRIAVIVVLIVIIYRAVKTPFMVEMLRRLRGLSKRNTFPGENSTL
jgi:hypothetical protein